MLGTVDAARAKGARGDDTEVTAALQSATARINAFCRDEFEPTTGTRALTLANGLAVAPVRLRAVTAVQSGTTTLPAPAWRAVRSNGSLDSAPDYLGVEVATVGGDGLIAGAEPWRGGWSNLYDSTDPTLLVTGDWGWLSAPADVTLAALLLAADLLPTPYEPQADAEGTARAVPDTDATVPDPEDVSPAGRVERTTGNARVDRLLLPYRRSQLRMT